MSMARIRKWYSVPAKRGMRVRYTGEGKLKAELGTITSARDLRLRIRLDGHKDPYIFHPTYGLEYMPEERA